jgi:hypothetical protein
MEDRWKSTEEYRSRRVLDDRVDLQVVRDVRDVRDLRDVRDVREWKSMSRAGARL